MSLENWLSYGLDCVTKSLLRCLGFSNTSKIEGRNLESVLEFRFFVHESLIHIHTGYRGNEIIFWTPNSTMILDNTPFTCKSNK